MNILMSLMSLDIGGAETHVAELSLELAKRGHHIVIASNGGSYVPELEKAGIKHYLVPLQNKKPQNVAKAFSELKKIIIDEKIDVVHSHARIPSFILGKIQKKMGFPFVTTAHGVFTTKYGLKYITNWGQKTLAVSEDIKKYLMDNYKIPESDITITVNGIDAEKFSPDIQKEDAMKELGLTNADNTIVHVSRMDKGVSDCAHMLIKAAEKLYPIIENLRIIIVGGGDDFDSVKQEAEEINSKLGSQVVSAVGARTNVNKLIAPAKLFVGISRAALEAMAEKKPVILAGNVGYIGLFDEKKLDISLKTNFCCRGCEPMNLDVLTQDIGNFFGMWEEEQQEIGEYSRNVVLDRYSVKKMADDAENVYNKVLEGKI